MKKIGISDMTLRTKSAALSFKEKIEVARQLENLHADCIEIPAIENARIDTLFVRTVSAFVKSSILSVGSGLSVEGVDAAAAALSAAAKKRIRIDVPVSTVGMEYEAHRKPPVVLELIGQLVAHAKESCADVEFCALDATRAEPGFLQSAIEAALAAGASAISVSDDAAEMLPDDFASFVSSLVSRIPALAEIPFGVACSDKNGMAAACSLLAAKSGASFIKTAVDGDIAPFETVAGIFKNCGEKNGLASGVRYTQLNRGARQIEWILGAAKSDARALSSSDGGERVELDKDDDPAVVIDAVKKLGYDLSDEDYGKVCEEFRRVAAKKAVTLRELDAIVASVALQVPPTYRLVSYVINNGNIISASAQIRLEKNDTAIDGIGMGDGPIDASFRTIEQIVGHHYELDDFQIQAVTEGREAMGSALVRLRSNGKLYSGNGISTDIIGASIRAYIGALNKIVYEEA